MDQLITGGGIAGLIVAVVYVGRLFLDWHKERRNAPHSERTSVVGDAATANGVLVQTVAALQGENARLLTRIKSLEDEDARKDRKITELEQRLAGIAHELAELRSSSAPPAL